MGSRSGICCRLRTGTLSTVDAQLGASSPALSRTRNPSVKSSWLHMRESTSRKWKGNSWRSVMAFLRSGTNLIPSASTDESKMLYYKMKSDYYRILPRCNRQDKEQSRRRCCVAYAEATKIAEKDLVSPSCPFGHGIVLPRWCLCRGAETDPHAPDCSKDRRDSTVAVYWRGGW